MAILSAAQMVLPVDGNLHGTTEILFVTSDGVLIFGADTLVHGVDIEHGVDPEPGEPIVGVMHKVVSCGPEMLCAIVGQNRIKHWGPVRNGTATTEINFDFKFPEWLPPYRDVVTNSGETRIEAMCRAITTKANSILPDLNLLARGGNLRPIYPNEKSVFGIVVVGYEPSGNFPELCHIRVDMDWASGTASVSKTETTLSAHSLLMTGLKENARAAHEGTNPALVARY